MNFRLWLREVAPILYIVATVTACLVNGCVAWSEGIRKGRSDSAAMFTKEAALMGHAEYIIDADGSPKWQWKPLPVENK
jgi:hypothetical protein